MKTYLLCLFACLCASAQDIRMSVLGTYRAPLSGGAAEIVAHDAGTQRLFVVNFPDWTVDVLDIRNPAAPRFLFKLGIPAEFGRFPNSVAVRNGVIAVALEAEVRTDPGGVVFYDADGNYLSGVRAGSLPDMVTFTPDGRYVLVANEGEPSNDYRIDPEGSVSLIDVSRGAANVTQADVRTAGFSQFSRASLDPAVRIYGPNATVAQDMEPEYIAVSPDSRTAWVTLQENNAIGVLDIAAGRFTSILPLGFKDHSQPGNGLDASDRDNRIGIRQWPVLGMYQPDTITTLRTADGRLYLLTANEGDARAYDGFSEERRIGELRLDPSAFPNAAELQRNENLGRLRVTDATGDTDGDGDFDRLYIYGARSFSVWTPEGRLVWDSGEQMERIMEANAPEAFNVSNADNVVDSRSDDKGPEPEAITVGEVNGVPYVFVGAERDSGIYVWEIADPANPRFVGRFANRDVRAPIDSAAAGDLGPEAIIFIPAASSPTGRPLLVTANEISGTTTIWQIE